MSEIEKMYENAGIKKLLYCDICKAQEYALGLCAETKCEPFYPPFTAEKQIELIKWLAGFQVHINNEGEVIYISTGDGYISYYAENLVDAITLCINSKWNNLSPEEKQQVKGILE